MMRQFSLAALLATAVLHIPSNSAWADGNIIAAQLGDTLLLYGDREANSLNVIFESDGDVFVLGKRTESPFRNPSTINGKQQVVLFNGVVDVVALTGAGGDWVEFHGDFPGDLYIDTGRGDDRIEVLMGGSAHISGDLLINMGSGRDGILFEGVRVTGMTQIDTGIGDDRIFFSFFNDFSSGLSVDTGGQDDSVTFLPRNTVGLALQIHLGTGNDALQLPILEDGLFVDGNGVLSGDQGIDELISETGIDVTGNLQVLDFE